MTGRALIIPTMPDERRISNREAAFAALDGETGPGGCEACNAVYSFEYRGEGIGHLTITHHRDCPYVAKRFGSAFLSDRDPGDEQP